jgi:hypothetical protein
MSNSYEPNIEDMRVELQVLTRAVSTLFATHPNPTALLAAWDTVMEDLKPQVIAANSSEIEKKRYDTHCAELRLATDFKGRIGKLLHTT